MLQKSSFSGKVWNWDSKVTNAWLNVDLEKYTESGNNLAVLSNDKHQRIKWQDKLGKSLEVTVPSLTLLGYMFSSFLWICHLAFFSLSIISSKRRGAINWAVIKEEKEEADVTYIERLLFGH